MIRIVDINCHAHYVAPASVARVVEAAPSAQWHGIRSYVYLFDGAVIEAQETARHINTLVEQALAKE